MWIDHIAAWTASGQLQRAYCAAQRLRYHAFDYWRRFVLKQNASLIPQSSTPPAAFIPVVGAASPAPGLAPHTAYLFCNRSGTRLRVLVWDGLGFWLCARRLERGRFLWPAADADSVELSAEQFSWLAAGVDWQRLSARAQALHCV